MGLAQCGKTTIFEKRCGATIFEVGTGPNNSCSFDCQSITAYIIGKLWVIYKDDSNFQDMFHYRALDV